MRKSIWVRELETEYDLDWLEHVRERQRRLRRKQMWWSLSKWMVKWFAIIAALTGVAAVMISWWVSWLFSNVR